jgi:AcrR family transcriptional regulator
MTTQEKILLTSQKLFATEGYEGVSIREIAKRVEIAPSVLYHYYSDKDELLLSLFNTLNTNLGKERAKLKKVTNFSDLLRQRIAFQLDHAEEIVVVLKYFFHKRRKFPKFQKGYVPPKTSLHIEEVLEFGVANGDIKNVDIQEDARVITHAINGFILEYYPDIPKGKERAELIDTIHTFLMKALKGGEYYERTNTR